MKKYEVYFEEIREKTVLIEANSREDAYKKGCDYYNKNKLQWDEKDIDHVDIDVGKLVLEHGSPYDELLEMKDKTEFRISDMEDISWYGLHQSNDNKGLLVLKKEKDTVWVATAQILNHEYKDGNELRLNMLENKTNEYIVVRFSDWSFMRLDTFRSAIEDIIQDHHAVYKDEGIRKYFAVESDIPFQEISAKQLHDLYKKSLFKNKIMQLNR